MNRGLALVGDWCSRLPTAARVLAILTILPGVMFLGGVNAARANTNIKYITSAPMAGVVNRSGWAVSCEAYAVEGGGYLPVRITVEPVPLAPTPEKRRLRVDIEVNRWPSSDWFSREFEIPEGSVRHTETVYITLGQGTWWHQCEFHFSEGGRSYSDLRCQFTSRNPRYGQMTDLESSLLFLDDDAPLMKDRRATIDRLLNSQDPARLPDFRQLANRLVGPTVGMPVTRDTNPPPRTSTVDAQVLMDLQQMHSVDLIPTSELPTRWLDLSNFSVTFIAWGDLDRLVNSKDARWGALRTWIAAGGTLIVYDMGPEFSRLRDLEKRLSLTSLPALNESERWPGWTLPIVQNWGKALPDVNIQQPGNASYIVLPNGAIQYIQPDGKPAPSEEKKPSKRPKDAMNFLTRELGMGLVVAIDASDPLPGYSLDWDWLFGQLGDSRFRLGKKLGLSRVGENPDFGNFLVRDVGQAPVWIFLSMITLFMVVMGPVNYFLLKFRRRLYMLFVTVPAAAALVTLALLIYAILSDGLHARSRIRGVTHIDQVAGVSSSWSRQVFFAGIAPSSGLEYPTEALVHPIDRWGMDERRSRRMEWTAESQRYRQGYLQSRTMSQMFVIDPHPTEAKLRIRETDVERGGLRVKNELGVDLIALAVRDERGRFFATENLRAGDEVSLAPVDPKGVQFADRLRDLGSQAALGPPQWDDSRSYRRRRYGWWNTTTNVGTATSLLEQAIQRTNLLVNEVPRRGYLAVATRPVETPLGIKSGEEQPDLNVVIGAW